MPTYNVYYNDEYGLKKNYTFTSGTSLSCPIVAGVVALILSKNNSLSPDEVKKIIRKNVDAYNSIYYLGTGRINAYEAVKKVKTKNNIFLNSVNTKYVYVGNIGTSGSNLNPICWVDLERFENLHIGLNGININFSINWSITNTETNEMTIVKMKIVFMGGTTGFKSKSLYKFGEGNWTGILSFEKFVNPYTTCTITLEITRYNNSFTNHINNKIICNESISSSFEAKKNNSIFHIFFNRHQKLFTLFQKIININQKMILSIFK
jgi:hypothetical protein